MGALRAWRGRLALRWRGCLWALVGIAALGSLLVLAFAAVLRELGRPAPAIRPALTIPNYPAASYAAQAAPDSGDFAAIVAAIDGAGVVSGCACSPQGSPDMTVAVGSGQTIFDGAASDVSAGNATIGTADGTHPRFDLVVSAAGTKTVRAGTAAANPVFPALTAGDVLLCAVYVPAGASTIDSSRITDKRVLLNYPLALPNVADPATPSSGLRLYSKNVSGRSLPMWIGPSGVDNPFQPALFGNSITVWNPGTGTTAAISWGVSWTVGATQSHPTIASTNLLSSIKRAVYTTSTTSGNASGVRSSAPVVWRGNAAGLGGFFFAGRVGVVTYQSAMQIWLGLSGVSGIIGGDPSAQNNTICFGKDTGDSTWQVITRDGSTAAKTDTGLSVAANQVFDVYLYAPPNASTITVRVVRRDSESVLVDNQVLSSNLPTNTTMLYAHAETRTNAASAVAVALARMYIESDY